MEKGKGVRKKRVVVFGIFDGVHAGHRFFFEQARKYGDELIVIVGRDEFVRTYKKKELLHTEQERIKALQKEEFIDDAVLSDKEMSSYHVLKHIQPDVICFGYDQDVLERDLMEWMKMSGIHITTYCLSKS